MMGNGKRFPRAGRGGKGLSVWWGGVVEWWSGVEGGAGIVAAYEDPNAFDGRWGYYLTYLPTYSINLE
jgi:hypothetical protein